VAPHAEATLVLDRSRVQGETLDSLGGVSHVWVVFVFHENTVGARKATGNGSGKKDGGGGGGGSGGKKDGGGFAPFQAKVTPPRLGLKVGVFSTRSPHRPNPVGLSVCEVLGVDEARGIVRLGGVDLVDGTPVLDLKPYIPYDSVPGARVPAWVMPPVAGDLSSAELAVDFCPAARAGLDALFPSLSPASSSSSSTPPATLGPLSFKGPLAHYRGRRAAFEACVVEVVSQDPRSVLLKAQTTGQSGGAPCVDPFDLAIDGVDVTFEAREGEMLVTAVAVTRPPLRAP
jgi:tRNA (Thr-GGU) A37 N-methylase